MADDQVTVVMAAKTEGVRVGAFEAVLGNLIGMLREVEPIANSGRKPATEWRITAAAMNSPLNISVGALKPHRSIQCPLVSTRTENSEWRILTSW